MKYLSPEHRILKLLWKFNQNRLVVKDRFMTDGDIDPQKVKDIFVSQGMKPLEARDAFLSLVAQGFANLRGHITLAGLKQMSDMEVAKEIEVDRLGLREFVSKGIGTPNDATLLELTNKEY